MGSCASCASLLDATIVRLFLRKYVSIYWHYVVPFTWHLFCEQSCLQGNAFLRVGPGGGVPLFFLFLKFFSTRREAPEVGFLSNFKKETTGTEPKKLWVFKGLSEGEGILSGFVSEPWVGGDPWLNRDLNREFRSPVYINYVPFLCCPRGWNSFRFQFVFFFWF